MGTINWEERKAADPERWNAFRSQLTYTCPVGFVIETPGRHDEQPEPIPETQEEFQVGTKFNIWLKKVHFLGGMC